MALTHTTNTGPYLTPDPATMAHRFRTRRGVGFVALMTVAVYALLRALDVP